MDAYFYRTLKQKSLQTLDSISTSDATNREVFKHNLNVLIELCDKMINTDQTDQQNHNNSSNENEIKPVAEELKTDVECESASKPENSIERKLMDLNLDQTPRIEANDSQQSLSLSAVQSQQQQIPEQTEINSTLDVQTKKASNVVIRRGRPRKDIKVIKTVNANRSLLERRQLSTNEPRARGRPKKSVKKKHNTSLPQFSNDIITLD